MLIGEARWRSRAINADWMDILSILNTAASMKLYYAIQENFEASNTDLRAMSEILYSDFIDWMYRNYGITTTHTTTEDIKAFSWDQITEQLNIYRSLEPYQNVSLESVQDFLLTYIPVPDPVNNQIENIPDTNQMFQHAISIHQRVQDQILRTIPGIPGINPPESINVNLNEIPQININRSGLNSLNFPVGLFDNTLQTRNAKYIIFGIAAILTGLLLSRSKAK